jgi:hypothetical protein
MVLTVSFVLSAVIGLFVTPHAVGVVIEVRTRQPSK